MQGQEDWWSLAGIVVDVKNVGIVRWQILDCDRTQELVEESKIKRLSPQPDDGRNGFDTWCSGRCKAD